MLRKTRHPNSRANEQFPQDDILLNKEWLAELDAGREDDGVFYLQGFQLQAKVEPTTYPHGYRGLTD